MLINKLPQDSWTQTALRDSDDPELQPVATEEPKYGPWALVNYQLAGLTDAVNALRYVTAVAGRLDPRPEVPKPTARPGMKQRLARVLDSEETRAARRYLDEFNRGKG